MPPYRELKLLTKTLPAQAAAFSVRNMTRREGCLVLTVAADEAVVLVRPLALVALRVLVPDTAVRLRGAVAVVAVVAVRQLPLPAVRVSGGAGVAAGAPGGGGRAHRVGLVQRGSVRVPALALEELRAHVLLDPVCRQHAERSAGNG